MRRHNFMKISIPCMAVVLSLTSMSVPAHAVFFDPIFKSISQFFSKDKTKTQKPKSLNTNDVQFGKNPTADMSGTTTAPSPSTSTLSTPTSTLAAKSSVSVVVLTPSIFSVEKDLIEKVISNIKVIGNRLNTAGAAAQKVDLVASETHTEIVPEYSTQGLKFKLLYDDTALKSPMLLLKDLFLIQVLTDSMGSSDIFKSQTSDPLNKYSFSELLSNVKAGSPIAKARWLTEQIFFLKNVTLSYSVAKHIGVSSNIFDEIRADLQGKEQYAVAEALKYIRQQQKTIDEWKSETGTLDKLEATQEKLDDLIMKNDRKGVRKLIETYLPWAVMEPVEVNTWKMWLDAIENPDPMKSTIALRGINYDTDKIQRIKTENGEIFGFMSTVLTKNQGNYTRRLRSLATNREKNGDIDFNPSEGRKVRTVKMMDQMTSHAEDPIASSFISFTFRPYIAKKFAGKNKQKEFKGKTVSVPGGGILVVKIDSRRMIPNLTSGFSNEVELLTPLIIFPDEILTYREGGFATENEYNVFVEKISMETGINFIKWDTATTESGETLHAKFNREGFSFLKDITSIQSAALSCSKIF